MSPIAPDPRVRVAAMDPAGRGDPGVGTVDEACTLPTAERPLRRAEFDDVFAFTREVRRESPVRVRLTLAGPDDLGATVRDLAEREAECCSFFSFAVGGDGGNVVLDIEVPSAYAGVLDGIAERAARHAAA